MALVNATLKNQRLDGTYTVFISISHKSNTSYITTGIVLDGPHQLKNNKIVKHHEAEFLNFKLNSLMKRVEKKLLELDVVKYSCKELVQYVKGKIKVGEGNTINYALSVYLQTLQREKSIRAYTLSVQRFIKFMGGDVILSSITPHEIQAYHNKLMTERLSPTTINIYMTHLKVVIDHAKKLKIVSYDVDPFEVYKKPQTIVRDLDITIKEMRRIKNMEPSTYPLQITRDIFMLSYYLGGINIGDMLAFNFRCKKQICYTRIKTEHTKQGNNQTCFTIQPEAAQLIKKYMNSSGKLVFGKYDSRSKIDNLLFRNMRNLALEADIHKHISYYTARKSFVQHGFELGIPLETLEYCIGQTMKKNRPIFNYVKIMSKHADIAIRQIIDYLNEK